MEYEISPKIGANISCQVSSGMANFGLAFSIPSISPSLAWLSTIYIYSRNLCLLLNRHACRRYPDHLRHHHPNPEATTTTATNHNQGPNASTNQSQGYTTATTAKATTTPPRTSRTCTYPYTTVCPKASIGDWIILSKSAVVQDVTHSWLENQFKVSSNVEHCGTYSQER